jgi:L-lactate dehydrogenase complex protein LldF
MNVCPVYERTGGHAYGSVYPGPIGAILAPQLAGLERSRTLPFASTLCGACYDACPVKIDIPAVLADLRRRVVERPGDGHRAERVAMRMTARVFASRRRYEAAQRAGRLGQAPFVRDGAITRLPGALGGWTIARDIRPLPDQSFRDWWRSRERERARGR